MMRRVAALAFLIAAGCDSAPPAVQQDVRDFLSRRAQCLHWTGEEGYDAARRAQINANYEKLRCAALDADEVELKRRYGSNPALLKVLGEARKAKP
jgi:hypothetical protein